jgi:hypothetical protein
MASGFEDGAQIAETAREKAALMQEILFAAIRALDGVGPTRRSAEAWTRAADDCWPLSFQTVCEALGLEPDVLRSELLAADPAWIPGVASDRAQRELVTPVEADDRAT